MAKNRKNRKSKKDSSSENEIGKRIVLAGAEVSLVIYPVEDGKLGKPQSFPDKITVPASDFKNLEKIVVQAYNILCSKYKLDDKGIS